MFSSFSRAILALLLTANLVLTATVTYNWDVTWVRVNPDNRLARPAVGINGQWPCPSIVANVGDQIVINVVNKLGNETTSIHFHGLFQSGTNSMDGPVGVVQCPIPVGGSFQYSFTIQQPGTYWYHSHDLGQYPDGFRGPIIIHDPANPYAGMYSEERTLTITDWYHDEMPGLLNFYLDNTRNPSGAEPVPYSALLNEGLNPKYAMVPGKTYFFRIISMTAFSAAVFHIDGHQMTIIEMDGVYTQPKTVDQIYVTTAQRYGVLITAKPSNSKNYAMIASFDESMYNYIPSYLIPNVTGYLVYNSAAPLPPQPVLASYTPVDDFTIPPEDGMKLLGTPDQTITFDMDFETVGGQNRAVMNNITWLAQKVPTLASVLTTGQYATNPKVYGPNANAYVLAPNSIVEIVVNNHDSGGHPFHLHGHNFQVVARSGVGAGDYNGDVRAFPAVPARRDTVMVNTGGYLVIRFRADNPGVWLFHCHIEWHVEAGLTATMVESPLLVQKQTVPRAQIDTCTSQGIPVRGNAAGNYQNPLDLTGANTAPPPNPTGAYV